MNPTKQKLRGLTFALWLLSESRPINFTMAIRVSGSFTPDQFGQTLKKIQRKYPSTAMRLIRESQGVYLIPDENLMFPIRMLERKDSGHWVEEATAELVQLFDSFNQPPIRFVWLRGQGISEIIFVCNHVFVDGYSAAYLLRDLFTFLSDPQADATPLPLVPPINDLIPEFSGKRMLIWQTKLKAVLLKFMISLRSKKGIQSEIEAAGDSHKYIILPWELNPQQTSALITKCQIEGTTVHAALSTAFLRACGELYGGSWRRKIQSPVNLRERLARPVGESFGLYINLVDFPADCSPDLDFWEVARKVKQGFIQHTADKPIYSSLLGTVVLMDELAPILTSKLVSDSRKKVDYDLSITNLGRLDFPTQYGSLQLEALYGPSIHGDPDEIVLSVVTFGGKMYFTLAFSDLKLTLLQAEQIKEKAMHWLAAATGWSS